MNKLLLTLLFVAPLAHADEWTGADKKMHFAAGAAISSTVLLATKSEGYASLAGCGVGALKEAYDMRHRGTHTPSAKDFVVTCAGAYLGGKATGLVLRANGITYTRSF